MCDFRIDRPEMERLGHRALVDRILSDVAGQFPGMVHLDDRGLTIRPEARPLTRVIARACDAYDQTKARHSAAI